MEELIRKALAGDREAFVQVVERRHKQVLNLAACCLGWRDAEDAAQIIWMAVWRKLWQVEDPARFEAWLRTLTFHQCLNLRKARARQWEREVQLKPEAWLGLAECVSDGSCPLEDMLEHRELRRLVSRELDKLPGDYGMLMRLYYLRDLSYKQVATITGLPQSTLKWRMHQGRNQLRANLTIHLAKSNLRRFSP